MMCTQYPARNKLPFAWFYDCVGVHIFLFFPVSEKNRKIRVDNILEIYHIVRLLPQGFYVMSVKHTGSD